MQGSKILHCVSEVMAAREPRMSLVNSYINTRPFAADRIKQGFYARIDGQERINYEFARHKAWRVAGKLQWMKEACDYESPAEDLTSVLREAALELLTAADLIDGLDNDDPKHLNETEKRGNGNE
jgi:hypothetical protein